MGLGAVVSSPCRASWRQRRIQRSSSACVGLESPCAVEKNPSAAEEAPFAARISP